MEALCVGPQSVSAGWAKADTRPIRKINLPLALKIPPFVASAMTRSLTLTKLLSPAYRAG